jgi:molybdate transport system ATP-binding protein
MTTEQGSLLEVELDRSEYRIDLRLEWQVKTLVLFGASGSGKTTLLRVLLGREVTHLSGGERQRVAFARAIAIRPRALLLDEPMASLDVGLRARVLPYLLRIREELDLPLVYITHDPDEAMLLGDEIAVLDRGRLIAQGAPRETLWSQAVHSLTTHLGVENVFEVDCVATGGSATRVRTRAGLELETPWPMTGGENLTLGIRAEDILVSLDRPSRISARNICPGRVAQIDPQSDHLLVHVDVGGDRLIAKLTEAAVEDLSLAPMSSVYLIIKSQALRRIR